METILIIDDEASFRSLIREILTDRGFTVLEAGSGAEGFLLARQALPGLIVCDVQMQDGDGYEALESLRKDSLTAAIPFILMTGEPAHDTNRKAMNLGADDILLKPFTGTELVAAVSARLNRQKGMVKEAERKLEELRFSISMMLPHELNTPLAGIIGLGELLKLYPESFGPKELSEFGQDIVASGTRLKHLTERFLLYAQLAMLGPGQMLDFSDEITNDAAQSTRSIATETAGKHGRASDLQLHLDGASAAISPQLFGRLIGELADNAFKFSDQGDPVSVRTFVRDSSAVIEVSDRGRGMSQDEIAGAGAFLQFQRKRFEQQGTGLGLVIARRIAEVHGGQLQLESSIGRGLLARLILPVAPTNQAVDSPKGATMRQPRATPWE